MVWGFHSTSTAQRYLACRGQRVEDVAVRLLASALQTKLFEEVRVQRRWSLPKSLSPFLSILLLLQRDERRSQSCHAARLSGETVRTGEWAEPTTITAWLFTCVEVPMNLPACKKEFSQRISPHRILTNGA